MVRLVARCDGTRDIWGRRDHSYAVVLGSRGRDSNHVGRAVDRLALAEGKPAVIHQTELNEQRLKCMNVQLRLENLLVIVENFRTII